MQNEKYKRNKWFVAVIIIMAALTAVSYQGNGYENWAPLILALWTIAILIYWPLDYLIYKRTKRTLRNKPIKVDLHFKLKRNLILTAIAVAVLVSWLESAN